MNKHIGKLEKKDAFLSYIYGYLNLVHVNQMRLPNDITWKEFREFKINEVGSYLGLSKRCTTVLVKPCSYLSFLEIILSYIIVICRYLYCISIKLVLLNKTIDSKIVSIDEGYSVDLINKAIDINEICFITIPFTNNKNFYKRVHHVNVLTYLRYREIFASLIWSIQLMTYMNKKYKHRDVFIRYYSSFDYFMAYIFSHNIGRDYTCLFYSTYSRWAYLNGRLANRKIFVQHGFLSGKWKLVRKIGEVEEAYYINEDQRKICEKMLFTNIPLYNYQKKLQFTLFPSVEKISVLIIGNSIYNEIEEEIISKLSKNMSLLLMIKPHPKTKNISFYNRMEAQFGVALMKKDDFPKVDYVISYNSTLATQYEDVGITIYRYSDDNFDEEISKLIIVSR